MKKVQIDSNSILDASTKKTMSQVFDFNKEYVTTETDKDTTYKAGEGVSISSDNTISLASVEDEPAIEQADSTTAGIMKLYSSTGSNTDGTMTQESITDELSSKAPTASPTFTGTPTAPTPSSSDTGSDRLATTAYVLSLLKNDPGIIDDILTALDNVKLGDFEVSGTTLSAALKENYFTNSELDPFNGTTHALGQQANHAKATLKMDDYGMMHFGASAFYFSTPDVDGEKFIEMNSGRLIIGAYESGYNGRSLLSMGNNGTSFQVDAQAGSFMTCQFDYAAGTIKLSAPNGVYAGSKRLDV